jgi:Ala-tRNA(Pro) deacylase
MAACFERLKYFFDENQVRYETQFHREVFTAQAVAAEIHEKGSHVAKVVMAWADGRPTMLVLPASAHVDFDLVRELLGADDVRREREEEFKYLFPDCEVGAMPPFGNLYNVPVYLDRSLAEQPYLVFQAGSHHETMRLAMADYLRLASPTVGEFSLRHPDAAVA